MNNKMVPYDGNLQAPTGEFVDPTGMAALAEINPQAFRRIEGLALKVQELRALTPVVENLSAAAAEAARLRTSQTGRPVETEFEASASHDSGCCCSYCRHTVRIRGHVRVSGT